MAIAGPIVRWWGRLEVVGESLVPTSGPTVLMANHDSMWDPLVLGVAGVRRRQIRALAKSSLWKYRPVAWVLDHMGQIPVDRGRADATALSSAIDQLAAGGCIGVFPEGTISRGQFVRPFSGAGRIALAVPGTHVIGARVLGAVDIVRFPKRPRLRVVFFDPAAGQVADGESAISLTRRLMTEIRESAPPALPGRAKKAAALRAAAKES
jgi:1-acyl-sn-glycerol-3-phosphate acyltransferase